MNYESIMEGIAPFFFEIGRIIFDNLYGLLAFTVSTLIAIIGIIYAYKQYRIARDQSSLSPRLELGFFGFSDEDVIDYYFLLPFRNNRSIVVPLIFNIGNQGTASAEDVELFYQVSEQLYRSDGIERRPSAFITARDMKLAVDPVTGFEVAQVFLNCRDISPEVHFQFSDSVIVKRETYLDSNVPVETKDNFKLNLTVYTYAWFRLSVSLLSRNKSPVVKNYNLHFRKLHSGRENAFLLEETRRRSEVSLNGIKQEARKEILSLCSSDTYRLMRELGMDSMIDQPMPNKLFLIWFDQEVSPDWIAKEDVPQGHDVVAVSGANRILLKAMNQPRKGKNRKRSKRDASVGEAHSR